MPAGTSRTLSRIRRTNALIRVFVMVSSISGRKYASDFFGSLYHNVRHCHHSRSFAMLKKEQNDLLTQTGPDTPMGRMFRSYWIPALLAEELPENDCPPVRVKLLSERLLAFRDTNGRRGLIDEFCAHRGVSLWFGRNEECGIRCPYHGWKYDAGGQCIEIPSEPEGSEFAGKVKLKSYPLIELGGILWTYMGP